MSPDAERVLQVVRAASPAGLTPYGVALGVAGIPAGGWGVGHAQVRATFAVLYELIAAGLIRREGPVCYLVDED